MDRWRLLDTGERPAHENIALDEALLEAKSNRPEIPNTIRFLKYSPSAVLIGFHQNVAEEVREDYCRMKGIDINRRITGGGAIFFDSSQIGWEIISNTHEGIFFDRIEKLYKQIGDAAARGIKNLGIDARFRGKNDIEVNGRKISGTGGAVEGEAFLFQGTLLVDFDVQTMLRSLRIPVEKLKDKEFDSIMERVTCLREELGHVPPDSEIKKAMLDGFRNSFGSDVEEGVLESDEKDLYNDKLKKFKSKEWINGAGPPVSNREVLKFAKKTPGGLVRVQVAVDVKNQKIHFALVTGDFFIYPKRTIYDLEAVLKDSSTSPSKAAELVDGFFRERNPQMQGLNREDFVECVVSALKKMEYLKMGFDTSEANGIFTVMEDFDNINSFDTFLLPYCAKLKGCDYRYKEDCIKCGKCSVGSAYELSESLGLKPVTIRNYENLQETLFRLKESGAVSFIGSCCEPFYIKHREDFQNIGLKGILLDVDNTTCYDLGQVEKAKAGEFREQTELRIELIRKVLYNKNHGNSGQ